MACVALGAILMSDGRQDKKRHGCREGACLPEAPLKWRARSWGFDGKVWDDGAFRRGLTTLSGRTPSIVLSTRRAVALQVTSQDDVERRIIIVVLPRATSHFSTPVRSS